MKKNKTIPECWDELNQPQFEYLLKKIFVMMVNETITQQDVLRDFADFLCGRKKFISPVKKADYLLLVNGVANILSWVFTPSPLEDSAGGEVLFNYDSVQNLIPKIGKLVGPQSAGYDLRLGEYRKACWMYNNYTINHDMESLNGLVGILYRRPAKDTKKSTFKGDYRESFNEYHIEKYAGRVKNVPEHIKWGVYLWFSYFCKYLMTGEFDIEGNEVSFAALFTSGGDPDGKKDENLGMTSVLFTLAESRTFGNVDETDNALLFKVMLKLLADHQTAENLKKS